MRVRFTSSTDQSGAHDSLIVQHSKFSPSLNSSSVYDAHAGIFLDPPILQKVETDCINSIRFLAVDAVNKALSGDTKVRRSCPTCIKTVRVPGSSKIGVNVVCIN